MNGSMAVGLAILGAALALSAFFSGAETGFYRATRLRLVLDARGGDWIAAGLLWLANHPALFVATVLIGNNLANYGISLAVVLITRGVAVEGTAWIELASTLIMTPLVFIYGEQLPKSLFFRAPNQLMRLAGPFALAAAILFLPFSIPLWLFSRGIEWAMGESPELVRSTLARKELRQVLVESQSAGILEPVQRKTAESLIAQAGAGVRGAGIPVGRAITARESMSKAEVLRLARRHDVPALPLVDPDSGRWIGYVRVIDLALSPSSTIDTVRPLPVIGVRETFIAALMALHASGEMLAVVVDEFGRPLELLSDDAAIERLVDRE